MSDPAVAPPASFHITHWKAGSMWVHAVLRQLAGDRFVQARGGPRLFAEGIPRPDGVYSPVYMSHRKFFQAVRHMPHRRIIVIRDLRDTLVSWYFSLRYSHPANVFVADQRARLGALDLEEGLESLIDGRLFHIANIQRSWLESAAADAGKGEAADVSLVVRYEAMIADEQGAFERICRHLRLDVTDAVRTQCVAANTFQCGAGREPGRKAAPSHRRKGIVGDWRNHFTDRVKDAFKAKYGQHLIDTGYEKNLDW